MTAIPIYKFALRKDLENRTEFLPTRAEDKATGWDVKAAISEPLIVKPLDYVKIPLGFRAFCPDGWWLELKPRSSTFAKKHMHALYGTIDETYEGEMVFAAQWLPKIDWAKDWDDDNEWMVQETWAEFCSKRFTIQPGEAIAQLIPILRQEMIVENASNEDYDKLCHNRNAQRGSGGFGSTDKKAK